MTRIQTPAQTRAAALGLCLGLLALALGLCLGLLALALGLAFVAAALGQIAALGFDIWAPRMAEELAALWH